MQEPKNYVEKNYIDDDLSRAASSGTARPSPANISFPLSRIVGDFYSVGQTSNGWIIVDISTEIYGDGTQSESYTYPYATYTVSSSTVSSLIYFATSSRAASTSSRALSTSSKIASPSILTTVVTKTHTTVGVSVVSTVVTSIATISIHPNVASSLLPPTPTSITISTPHPTQSPVSNSHDTPQLTYLQWIGIALGIFFFLLLIIALISFRRCTRKKQRAKAKEMRYNETGRNEQADQTQLQRQYRPTSPPPPFEAAVLGGEERKEKAWQGMVYVDGRDQGHNGIAEVEGRQSERARVEMPAEGIVEIG